MADKEEIICDQKNYNSPTFCLLIHLGIISIRRQPWLYFPQKCLTILEDYLEETIHMIAKNNGLVSLKVNRWAVKKKTLASVLFQVCENIPMRRLQFLSCNPTVGAKNKKVWHKLNKMASQDETNLLHWLYHICKYVMVWYLWIDSEKH